LAKLVVESRKEQKELQDIAGEGLSSLLGKAISSFEEIVYTLIYLINLFKYSFK
jgi:hypothetical protein